MIAAYDVPPVGRGYEIQAQSRLTQNFFALSVKIIESPLPIATNSLRLGGGMEALLSEYGEEYDAMMQELSIYKVRIENILCETDIKEQDHLPMDHRLW